MARRLMAALFGGLIGLTVGGVAVLNMFIFAGIERGYEAGLDDVFAERPIVAVMAVAILVSFPVIGAIVGLKRRSR